MSLTDNKQFMAHFVEEVLNKKNLSAIDDIVAENFLEHIPFPGQGPGREGLRDIVVVFITAFPDLHWDIDEQIAEGEKVVTRFTMTGTHHGDFMGIPPTGRSVNVWGIVIDVVRNGLFSESRIILDSPALIQQLTA